MDDRKDIQHLEILSRFFENFHFRANTFGLNQSADRAYRRAERICAGLYLATNHVRVEEPLRESVRRSSLALLQHALALRDELRASNSTRSQNCAALIRNLASKVLLLTVGGYLSEQNASILTRALDDLASFLTTSQGSQLAESLPFSETDFQDIGRKVLKDIKDTSVVKNIAPEKDKKDMSNIVPIALSVSVRKRGILDVLSLSKDLGIKDIAANLPEYSEKMIQRDLVELVEEGKVQRVGLKRWSKYCLMRQA